MPSHRFRVVLAAIAVLTVAGCPGPQEMGAADNLVFAYDGDDPPPSIETPIAVGSQIDLRVEDPWTGSPLAIDRASIGEEGVIAIVATDRDRVTLRGIGVGRAVLRVTANRDGESISDSIELAAAEASRVELGTGCAGGEEGVYLASSRIAIPYELVGADGAPRIGYGPPLEIAPPSSLVLVGARSTQYLMLRTGSDASRVAITSSIGGARLDLEIVEEASIAGAHLRLEAGGEHVPLGTTRFALLQPYLEDHRVLCQGTLATETFDRSPQICRVVPVRDLRADREIGRTYGWLQITGAAPGSCRFTVRYPNAAGGRGLSLPFRLEVR